MNTKHNYILLFIELEQGKSLGKIAKEHKIDIKALRKNFQKIDQKRYEELVYGKIIGEYNGHILRKIPKNQTNSNECSITKEVKKILIAQCDCIEEVGVWSNNYTVKHTIDLYSFKNKIGFEIYYQSGETFNQLHQKLTKYKELFGDVVCILIKDTRKIHTRNYYYIRQKLEISGFKYLLVDMGTPTPIDHT